MSLLLGMVPRSVWLALGALALLAAAAYATYSAGENAADARWNARQADAARQANKKLLANVELGIQASSGLQRALAAQAGAYDGLRKEFNDLKRRTPLIVTRVVTRSPEATGASDSGDSAVADLSRAALWMWNSALAGRDVPAASCGLADTSDAACAAGAGVSLDAAFDNHALNARSCAVDRLRYQQLLDLLAKRQATASLSPQP